MGNNNNNDSVEKYKIIVGLIAYYNKSLWQNFLMYFLPHSLLLSFLFISSFDQKYSIPNWLYPIFLFIGPVACFFWFCSYRRMKKWRDFRFTQARKLEPKEWNIINGDGKKISDGGLIILDKPYQMDWTEKIGKWDAYFIISSYTAAYLIIAIHHYSDLLFRVVYYLVKER